MTLIEFAAAHPFWTLIYLMVITSALSGLGRH